jgi:hypothetical protein
MKYIVEHKLKYILKASDNFSSRLPAIPPWIHCINTIMNPTEFKKYSTNNNTYKQIYLQIIYNNTDASKSLAEVTASVI